MMDTNFDTVLKIFKLNDKQCIAATEFGRDVVVTAGAGSGKTSTLVARYVCLLAKGVSPRRIAAITFTKKAAREMRSRVREKLTNLQQLSATEEERQIWMDLSSRMDSARIGTIHSLCTEIIRTHPAEGGVDPRFEVLDEGMAAAYMVQAVNDSLKQMVEEERFLPLLRSFSVSGLNGILLDMLKRRLEVDETFAIPLDNFTRIANELRQRMAHPTIQGIINEMRGFSYEEMVRDTGDTLAPIMSDILNLWTRAEASLTSGDPISCAINLYQIRREKLTQRGGKKGSLVKDSFDQLKALFDELLNPLTGGKDSKDAAPSMEVEGFFEELLPLMREAFNIVHHSYKEQLDAQQALDFDDLEHGAQQLLRHPEIRARWQGEIDYVLVDEFQDTNQRQRDIIRALTGSPGRLFIVGDMRQSIYRFRRADVTVFSDEQERIREEGGLRIDLDMTYRAHEPLLDLTGELLSAIIGTEVDPDRKYYVPYTSLIACEKVPHEGYKAPHVEFVIGGGEDTESSRPVAARALAARLVQLKLEGQIKRWDDVALLFRAATGFPAYEDAFESAGIPFVTVAGRGFYDRPEVRDLVNILRALADPLDDLSFAGLLRSPAFGLSDAALYLLGQGGQPYWIALQGDIDTLSESDQHKAKRTIDILNELLPLVDRVPVAGLVKKIVDAVDYRAILATADRKSDNKDTGSTSGRLWRNIDKLLEDAQVSQQVNVRNFLDMLATLNDAGAREGEAPAEAQGAVRLMTIHKSKGLEFPVVVLADASRAGRFTSPGFYLSNDLGVTLNLDPAPMLYKVAKYVDKDQDECEKLRLLYVALTRAKSKLVISTSATVSEDGGIKLREWADDLTNAAGLNLGAFLDSENGVVDCVSNAGHPLRAWCLLPEMAVPTVNLPAVEEDQVPEVNLAPLYPPLDVEHEEVEEQTALQDLRATGGAGWIPKNVIGNLVHKAIQRWIFPGDARLDILLRTAALDAGLATEVQVQAAVDEAVELLKRVASHPIRNEIEEAAEQYHEVPYSRMVGDHTETGYIDLLYRDKDGWQIVDFKTDAIYSEAHRDELVAEYASQMRRYAGAIETLLGESTRVRICFLDDMGKVGVVEV